MGPNQTYKLLHNQINNKQNKKTTYRMGEKTQAMWKTGAQIPKYTNSP